MVRPFEDLVGEVPVVVKRLALESKDRDAGFGDCGCGMVLRREDVARGPPDLRAERGQGLDQDRGLDGHVQRAGDARTLERLGGGEFVADCHQAGHLGLGNADLLAAPGSKRHVGNFVVVEDGGFEYGIHRDSLQCKSALQAAQV